MAEQADIIIIGAGQAGLSLSYYLTQQGLSHTILEQGQIGETWRTQRWDSFSLATPNWMIQLPDFAYQGDEPDGFFTTEEVVHYLERYAHSFHAPIQYGVQVKAVQQQADTGKYLVETNSTTYEAANVVLATGPYTSPRLPPGNDTLPADITQIHSSNYKNPHSLPPGGVLVVGTGQSGFQIAEELYDSGRQVYLSTSSCARTPQRYRGKDVAWWLARMGFFDRTLDQLPSPQAKYACSPHVTSKHNGNDVTLPQLGEKGVILLGHVQSVQNQRIQLLPDLEENLAKAEGFATQVKRMIDGYIAKTQMEAPADDTPVAPPERPAKREPIVTLDLPSTDIKTIIWATGFKPDFSWVHAPVFDQMGNPVHQRGVTELPGLYFLGLHWLYKQKSALLFGIGEDAAHIASSIAARH